MCDVYECACEIIFNIFHFSLFRVRLLADGSVLTEVHSLGTYRQLFGTWAGYDASRPETIYPVMLPYKVSLLDMHHILPEQVPHLKSSVTFIMYT